MEKLLEDLNNKQQEAVLCTEGPVMIIAGAGSGKTRVLTTRIKYLIQAKQTNPEKILAVTFTNKAAREMEHRIGARLPWIGTFHGICGKILRLYIDKLPGYKKNYVIFDDNDQLSLIKTICKELNIDTKKTTPQKILGQIGWAKNRMLTWQEYAKSSQSDFQETIAEIYRIYQESLRRNNAVDFDDMLLLTIELFQKNPDVLNMFQEKFQYVLVDEYQDTNKAQYLLVQMLSAKYKNICVVGDHDQNIYSWRGADITNILSFESDFKNSKTILLEQNYRSTKNILDIANAVIKNNKIRKEKNLWTNNGAGDDAVFYHAGTEKDEVKYVLDTLDKERAALFPLNNYAVFYRTNAQSRVFEEELIKRGIPYRLVGGTKFYARKEVKDILSYLRLILNAQDELALNRIINVPPRGIGDLTLAKYALFAEKNRINFYDTLQLKIEGVSDRAHLAMQGFYLMIEEFRRVQEQTPLADLIDMVIHKSGYHAMLMGSNDETDLDRIDNIFELVTMARERTDMDLAQFLEHISLLAGIDSLKESGDAITLMTIHSAKGLEYPVVFLTGLEESVLPHFRSLYEPEAMEEERRLCYVAITRAQKKIFMTAVHRRSQAGETRMNEVSRFVNEVPAELLERIEPAVSLFGGGAELSYDASARTAAPAKVQNIQEYASGDVIFHNKWGKGRILKVFGSGEEQVLDIQFLRVRKTIMAKYAQIQKA